MREAEAIQDAYRAYGHVLAETHDREQARWVAEWVFWSGLRDVADGARRHELWRGGVPSRTEPVFQVELRGGEPSFFIIPQEGAATRPSAEGLGNR
jgi:hypothetical protein